VEPGQQDSSPLACVVERPGDGRQVTQDRPNSEVVRAHPDGTALIVRVVPGAASSCLAGLAGGVLRVRIAAPAVEGKANAALLSFLAGRLGLRPRALRLVAGERGREKRVVIRGRTPEEVRAALGLAEHTG
jgi:uncharacterized protein (TIGR00251 family)